MLRVTNRGQVYILTVLTLFIFFVGMVRGTRAAATGEGKLPELWVHGCPKMPQKLKPLHAQGARMFVDLRRFFGRDALAYLQKYIKAGIGICLTLRWMDPMKKDEPDIAPSRSEQAAKTNILMDILTSPESKKLGGRIWVQFFNEITGGPGTIRPEQADIMFNWATETARRIRKEAPHVKICGPALTGLDVLRKNQNTLTRRGRLRRKGLLRAIAWSARYADAIDLHLHLESGDKARQGIRLLRDLLNREPNGKNCKILSWEWSPARYRPRSDLAAAREALIDIYRAMAEAGFPTAAYACYYPAIHLKTDRFVWQAIVKDKKHTPNEPFYSTLSQIGAGKIDVLNYK